MTDKDFDANERIAGFSLVSIKRTLLQVGLLDDRDDIASVSEALTCPPQQAKRVLEELERRGLVRKAPGRRQWDTTPEGNKLAFHWHPPRRFTPAIERDPASRGFNEGFESVPCSIWRFTSDQEEMFEEAEIDVALHVEYEGDRLIEINVTQPDEYQGESAGSALTALSVYVSAADARRFAVGLQKAIEKAEAEVARHATRKARQAEHAEARRLKPKKKGQREPAGGGGKEPVEARGRRSPPPAPGSNANECPAASKKRLSGNASPTLPAPPSTLAAEVLAEGVEARARSKEAVSASLTELREANRARRMARPTSADGKSK